jgi:hypothetical protein
LLRAIILVSAVASALVLYFSLSLYVLPQLYQSTEPRRPEAAVTNVSVLASKVELGHAFVVSVIGINIGEVADMQIVSIGFPNLTTTDNFKVLMHDFAQTPIFISPGDEVSSEYGERSVEAQYPSVEAYSRPWVSGRTYGIDLQVMPEAAGQLVIYVKSIAFPHSWDEAHWPQDGIVDYQKEFVQVHYVQVTKP